MKINFKNLNIDKVSHASGVFSGENMQVDWKYSKKNNEGFGTVSGGHNTYSNNHHMVTKHIHSEKKDQ